MTPAPNAPLPFIAAADLTSFYQLKTMLQGVVARGTARAIADLSLHLAVRHYMLKLMDIARPNNERLRMDHFIRVQSLETD